MQIQKRDNVNYFGAKKGDDSVITKGVTVCLEGAQPIAGCVKAQYDCVRIRVLVLSSQ